MGTRHLIVVIDAYGATRVAQYGQWDGYPEGQGVNILSFISDRLNLATLSKKLSHTRFLDVNGVDKEFITDYNKKTPEWSSQPDNRTKEQRSWWDAYMSRDLGAKILENISYSCDNPIILGDSYNFAGNSLFCEWAYVIDLSADVFEVYRGPNKKPLTVKDRFYILKNTDSEYEPVKKVAEWKLNELPTKEEFLLELNDEKEGEE